MIPSTLKDFNFFIDESPMLGRAIEITLPKLTRKTEELQAAGMIAPVDIDYGMEKMTLEFTLAEFNRDILRHYGMADASGLQARFLGAAEADNADAVTEAIEIVTRGRLTEFDFGTAKKGGPNEVKATQSLTYFKYMVDGDTFIEIDTLNGKEIIDGVDRLANRRAAIGL